MAPCNGGHTPLNPHGAPRLPETRHSRDSTLDSAGATLPDARFPHPHPKMPRSLLLLLCSLVLPALTAAAESRWTDADRQYTVENLTRTRDELIRETANLTAAQWSFQESPDRWSIAGVVEHLGIWEIMYWREIGVTLRGTPQPELNQSSRPDSYYREFIMEEKPHQAQDITKPMGLMRGPEAIAFFVRSRDLAIDLAKTTKADLRAYFDYTGPGNSPRNAHQIFLYQWGHVDRHLRQIRKIKAHPGYPRS